MSLIQLQPVLQDVLNKEPQFKQCYESSPSVRGIVDVAVRQADLLKTFDDMLQGWPEARDRLREMREQAASVMTATDELLARMDGDTQGKC